MTVTIYAMGIVHCSVCAPKKMSKVGVEEWMNNHSPTGIESTWHVSEEKFATGQPNPCQCDTDASRRHWLLTC